jgi:hypothetical protein
VLDVAEEHRTRTDEQHTLGREPAPVRVQEIRGAVQRDRGLSGARPARDDESALDLGSDRLVLFGLDRRDDVAHTSGAVAFEGGEERALAGDLQPFGLDRVLVEDLIVEADDFAALSGDEVPAAHDAHRRDRGRAVEGLGDGRAPVDDERSVVIVFDRDAADVPTRGILHVEPTEQQRRFADLEVGEPALGDVPRDVALEPRLVRSTRADVGVRGSDPLRRGPHRLEAGIGARDVRLLLGELGIGAGLGQTAQPLDGGPRAKRIAGIDQFTRAPEQSNPRRR